MSNERKMLKITIEMPDGTTKVIGCDGFAATTVTDRGDHHHCANLIMGSLSVSDLFCLRNNIQTKLVPDIEEHIAEDMSPSDVAKLLEHVFKTKEGEE